MVVFRPMTKTRHMLTSAPLAIAAMAALPLFPASAQEQPVIVLPSTEMYEA